jgi:hypothetical protein
MRGFLKRGNRFHQVMERSKGILIQIIYHFEIFPLM